jgi:hypothetical protein
MLRRRTYIAGSERFSNGRSLAEIGSEQYFAREFRKWKFDFIRF